MKLKGILGTLMLTLLIGSATYAQDSTAVDDCGKNRSLYYQYLKQKMFKDAADFWTKAVEHCGVENLDAKFYTNGRYLYSKLLKDEKYAFRVEGINDTIDWIYERRMAPEGTLPSNLAIPAARLALDKSGLLASDIGLVIFCGIEGDRSEPATAHIIQNELVSRNEQIGLTNLELIIIEHCGQTNDNHDNDKKHGGNLRCN